MNKMDDKKPGQKTEEAPADLRPSLMEAQQVTPTNKIRRNQIKTQGVSQLAESLLNTTEELERKRRRKGDSKKSKDPKEVGLEEAGTIGVGL